MPVAAGIGAAGAIGSAGIGAFASSKASSQQVAAQQAALAQQNALFQRGVDLVQPFVNAGNGAATTLSGLLTPGPNQTQILSQLPGFQFAQDWGQKAVQNIGSTTGLGGNVLKAGADYATGVAQQGFGSLAGLLQNLVATGSNAASSVLSGSVQQGGVIGNTFGNIGNSQAAGTLGTANALSGGLTGAANSTTNALFLSKLLNNNVNTANPNNGSGIYTGDPTIPGFAT